MHQFIIASVLFACTGGLGPGSVDVEETMFDEDNAQFGPPPELVYEVIGDVPMLIGDDQLFNLHHEKGDWVNGQLLPDTFTPVWYGLDGAVLHDGADLVVETRRPEQFSQLAAHFVRLDDGDVLVGRYIATESGEVDRLFRYGPSGVLRGTTDRDPPHRMPASGRAKAAPGSDDVYTLESIADQSYVCLFEVNGDEKWCELGEVPEPPENYWPDNTGGVLGVGTGFGGLTPDEDGVWVAGAAVHARYADCGINLCADATGYAWVGYFDATGVLEQYAPLEVEPWAESTWAGRVVPLADGNLLVFGQWQTDSIYPESVNWTYLQTWTLSPSLRLLRSRRMFPQTGGMRPIDAIRVGEQIVVLAELPGDAQWVLLVYDGEGELVSRTGIPLLNVGPVTLTAIDDRRFLMNIGSAAQTWQLPE